MSGSVKIEGEFAVIRIPLSEVHNLRVELQPCPCRATKSAATQAGRKSLSGKIQKALGGINVTVPQ